MNLLPYGVLSFVRLFNFEELGLERFEFTPDTGPLTYKAVGRLIRLPELTSLKKGLTPPVHVVSNRQASMRYRLESLFFGSLTQQIFFIPIKNDLSGHLSASP